MTERREMRDLVSLEEAREVIEELALDGGTERIALADANGRVLADRTTAELDVPGFDRAAMDGYAVRAADTRAAGEMTPVELAVTGRVAAGERPDVAVEPGTAVEIATGAVIPPDADAVVEVEATSERDGAVAIRRALPPGENVMAAGADVAAGDPALAAGVCLTPRTVGLLAALGHEAVAVRRRPRVAIVATGEELVQPGDPLDHDRGQIYDVNTATIAAGVADAGGVPERYTRVPDDQEAMRETLEQAAAECDLVLTAGSTSAGSDDLLYRVVETIGEMRVHGVALKPGKPTIVGTVDGTPYVGLPGYPVSALSVFRLLVVPRLRRAAGRQAELSVTATGRLARESRFDEGRRRALPVGLVEGGDGELLVYPVETGSGATTTLAYADGVVDVPADTRRLRTDQDVTVELFAADARPPALLAVGESDPAATRLLDRVDRVRYLPEGSRAGERWLRDDVADVAVRTGEPDGDGSTPGADAELAAWHREWGVVLSSAVADERLEDDPRSLLTSGELTVATSSPDLGLRAALDRALEAAGIDPGAASGATTSGIESPARRVAEGRADVGVALRETAARLDVPFVTIDTQRVAVVGNPSRSSKSGMDALETAVADLGAIISELPGYER